MKIMLFFPMFIFISMLAYCQDYDCFEFESIPGRTGMHFFSKINFTSREMIVKSSYYIDRLIDEEKFQLKRVEINKIKNCINKNKIFYVPDSTRIGFDGITMRIKFLKNDIIIKESFAWSKYINESYLNVYKCISRIVIMHTKNIELRSYLKQRIEERK